MNWNPPGERNASPSLKIRRVRRQGGRVECNKTADCTFLIFEFAWIRLTLRVRLDIDRQFFADKYCRFWFDNHKLADVDIAFGEFTGSRKVGNMRSGKERRKSERFQHTSAVLHSTIPPDFFYRGTMHNYSAEGLYFESNEDLLQGDEISISIQNPPRQFHKAPQEYFDVEIMWCKVLKGVNYQVGYGAKIK